MEEYRFLADKENLANNKIMSYSYEGFILTETGNPDEGMKHYQQGIDLIEAAEFPENQRRNILKSFR